MIFQILGFLLSAAGLFIFLLGVLSFLVMFIVPAISGVGRRLTDLYIWLSLWCMNRAAIVVSEHGELLFKRMSFDDLGVEKIPFGDGTKDFEDPATALHHWKGFPFALADEVHGILFDPRHAAIGEKKREYDERDLGAVRATEEDWNTHGIDEWIPGVFEFADGHQLVDLSAIRSIVDGGERAEYPTRVEELYKKAQLPFSGGMPELRLALPAIVFVGTIIMWWQLGGKTGGGGGGSTVSYGILPLVTIATAGIAGDWKHMAKMVAGVAALPLLFILIMTLTNAVFAFVVFIIFGLGFAFVPLFTFVARMSSKLSASMSSFYMRLGLLGYNRPVLEWTPRSYRLREFDDLDHDGETVKWYTLAGSPIGFTFAPGEESFGPDVVSTDRLESGKEVVTDGGEDRSADLDIPAGYTRCPALKRDIYGAYVPNRIKESSLYLHSGIALNRMTDAAIGEKSLRRLLYSKEKHGGGGSGISDRTVLWATVGCLVLGNVIGIPLFVL